MYWQAIDRTPMPEGIDELIEAALDRVSSAHDWVTGLPTGFIDLDERILGLHSGDLIVVAARPAMGKTTFALQLVLHAALHQDKPVLVFSNEVPAVSLTLRLLASIARTHQHGLHPGRVPEEDQARLAEAAAKLKNRPLFMGDTRLFALDEIRATVRATERAKGTPALIVIDSVQALEESRPNSCSLYDEAALSRSLKQTAREFRCPVVVTSKVSRAIESRRDKRPRMMDICGDGSLERYADVILMLYRDEIYNEDTPYPGMVEICIAREPDGSNSTILMNFSKEHGGFGNR